jgi:DNA-binding LytR/AlgR family response regulator
MESQQASEAVRVVVSIRDDASRAALVAQLSGFDDVIVVARTTSAKQALHTIQHLAPDLVFFDRSMLTSHEVRDVRRVLARGAPLIAFVMTEPQPPEAFEPNAIDYLTLPVLRRRTRVTIERAKERLDAATTRGTSTPMASVSVSPASSEVPTGRFLRRIPARTRDGVRLIPVEELVSAVANRWYLHLTTSAGERHTILYSLKDLESRLDPAQFIRLSRNTLVNVAFVRRIVPARNGLSTIELSNGETHGASRRQSRELREWLLRL